MSLPSPVKCIICCCGEGRSQRSVKSVKSRLEVTLVSMCIWCKDCCHSNTFLLEVESCLDKTFPKIKVTEEHVYGPGEKNIQAKVRTVRNISLSLLFQSKKAKYYKETKKSTSSHRAKILTEDRTTCCSSVLCEGGPLRQKMTIKH